MHIQTYFNTGYLLISTAIAAATWLIARRQVVASEEKLRLDLYERRFAVYSRAVDFFQALTMWQSSPSDQESLRLFVKSKLEASFLFPPDSGITQSLEEMYTGAFKVIGLKEHGKDLSGDPLSFMKFYNDGMKALTEFGVGVTALQARMAPFLDFHRLRSKGARSSKEYS